MLTEDLKIAQAVYVSVEKSVLYKLNVQIDEYFGGGENIVTGLSITLPKS